MPSGPATILGGLPVIADVWFTRGDGWSTDDDAGVDTLYWMKRDGSKGKPLPEHMYDRLEKSDPYWECGVTEAVFDHLAHEQWERQQIGALAAIIALIRMAHERQ
ncbi:hypothetical protein [Sphingomonas jaspsi]|uniref:hypothetical protein n=1 Tax=Sphingomonas jaspsi TaxID=392409 RepID=UPI0004B593EB|nr:hypothetical protein [Sphingomonas jaspsi]